MATAWDEIRGGWTTIFSAAAGACVGITGLAFYTFGLFVKPLSQAFGWSRGEIALGMTCITLGTVVTAPLVGLLIDRFGVRRVALPSLIGIGLAYALLSRVNASIFSFYLACLGISLLGCATSPVTWTRVISLTFQRSRGLALGLTLLGGATAGLVGGPAVQSVIAQHGWRTGYLAMGAFTVLIAFPVVLLLMRGPARGERTAGAELTGMSPAAAFRTAPFWILGVAILALITAQSGVIIHLAPLLSDRGFTPGQAAAMAGVMGLSIFVSRVGVGALLDRFHPPVVAGLVLLAPVAATVIMALCGANTALLITAIILLGLSAGAEIDFLSFFTGRHFGLRAYGKIYGVLFAMFSIGNGLGAPLVGAAFDHFKTYGPALWAASGLFTFGAALFASLGRFPVWTAPTFAED